MERIAHQSIRAESMPSRKPYIPWSLSRSFGVRIILMSNKSRLIVGLVALAAFSQPPLVVKIPFYNPSSQQTAYAAMGPEFQLINGVFHLTNPQSATVNFADNETPIGAIDGSNPVFALAHA